MFSEPSRAWFGRALGIPTEVQRLGWREIAAGHHALLSAPTGSGKTLAAFFWCLDRLVTEPEPDNLARCRVLYVSPLKALAFDIDRNLRGPLAGISLEAQRIGMSVPPIRARVRTGDTPAEERRTMKRRPPDILITTPESLFLLLTSAARVILDPVRWIIVDEIHTMAATKRGAHLAVSLERLSHRTSREPQRIGLSATQKPLDEVARYLGGRDREVAIVEAAKNKTLDLSVIRPEESEVPVPESLGLQSGSAAAIGASQRPVGITTEIASARPWAQGDGAAQPVVRGSSNRSMWPAIYPRILDLIRGHRSTIVFVNSRRMAERMAAKLNELAGEELVRAHHGSIAREQRVVIEDLLKAGSLPGLIATSSLELGIDMGAVDLVIQVGSPTTVARGIQRVGRAGHAVGEPSIGMFFPSHRGDLLETAAVVEQMLAGDIETTRVPRNPIDVLAQHIVAMCAMDTWAVEELRQLVMQAYPFSELGDRAFNATLDMLDGRYPSEEFGELRPRIVWDRVHGTIRGRQGAQRLAVVSGGTIPDRGLYTVNLFDDGKRIGELDEEMVYELRPGETFVLGATTWKVAEITQSQVRVAPAPGEPGKITFWLGDTVGRPIEVGRAVGALTREVLHMSPGKAIARLTGSCRCDPTAASELMAYLREQHTATTATPDDRTIVIERFRDQIGDWRICVLTPFGSRVHGPWSLAAQARLHERTGFEIQSIYSDEGFALRLVEAEVIPPAADLFMDPSDVRDEVTAQLHGSAMFASRFRENAARALLLPRRRPGSRTPLWLQRQRSADLLAVASRYPDFPILAETYRECLTDVFDIPGLIDLMSGVQRREIRVVEVETASPSPFASTLVFDYVSQYIYDGDQPLAERRAQALTLDRELLNELLGSDDLRELLDPDVIAETEIELQRLNGQWSPRDADETHDLLRQLGDLTEDELRARGAHAQFVADLKRESRAIALRIGGEIRYVAAADAALYRDAIGASLPIGLPDAFTQPVERPLEQLLIRWADTHVPFQPAEPAARWHLPIGAMISAIEAMEKHGTLVAGLFRAHAADREYCSQDVLRILRRRSLAKLRREIEPVDQVVLARFEPAWQGLGFQARGLERLAEVVAQLQGAPIPVSVLERDVLTSRMTAYTPALLDELIGMGEVVWIGRGSLGLNDGRISLYMRGDVPRLVRPLNAELTHPESELTAAIRDRLSRGPCFFTDLVTQCEGNRDDILDAVWELVWTGDVTNDLFSPLRFIGPHKRTVRRGITRLGPPRSLGRWSLVADMLNPSLSSTEHLHALAQTLLQRYGVLTREHVVGEGIVGGFAMLYSCLRMMEESGQVRRGYFVEGLGGAQFALDGAVDRLRSHRSTGEENIVLLATTDPACAYGFTVPWPQLKARPARAAGAYVVLDQGDLRLFVERGGRSVATHGEVTEEHLARLREVGARLGKLELRTIDGAPVTESPLVGNLVALGFQPTHRGLVFYP
jgi:ATP-dependent Lhr-like helicase